MAKLIIEGSILIVRHYHFAIFHTECVAEIVIQFMPAYFNGPAFQVLAVKELFPFSFVLCKSGNGYQCKDEYE